MACVYKQQLLQPDNRVTPKSRSRDAAQIPASAEPETYVPPSIFSFKLTDAAGQALLQQMLERKIAR
jgi:hypothetical protein